MQFPEHYITQQDAVNFLKELKDESVNLVITDPPYESLEAHRKIGTTTRLKHSAGSSNDWFEIFPNERFAEMFAEIYRVLRTNSHCYMFCDSKTMFVAKPIAEEAGFQFHKPLVWDKRVMGMGYHYRARYEFILLLEKGDRTMNDYYIPDIIECKRIYKGYPTEKPVSVMRTLVSQSSDEGDIVCDPFMGSGAVGVAALELKRSFWGNDLSPNSIEIAHKRLLDATASFFGDSK
jgi:site-specific DNA-methyltransferase (adenine-specific)